MHNIYPCIKLINSKPAHLFVGRGARNTDCRQIEQPGENIIFSFLVYDFRIKPPLWTCLSFSHLLNYSFNPSIY